MPEKPNTGAATYNKGKQLEVQIGPDKAKHLADLMLQGKPVLALVDVVQKDWGMLTHLKPNTVRTMLYRYSEKVVKQDLIRRVANTVETKNHVAVTTLVELDALCQKQKKRVETALTLETTMKGMLTDMATKQIGLYAGMLKDLAVLQMETGILPRAPKTVKGMMLGPDGSPTHFGWIESDDVLLESLQSSLTTTHEPT